jgi:N-acetylglutamate synthase-like GNAT family acetyltransferase
MNSLIIRAASVRDVPSIVRIRLRTLNEEEIRGFSSPDSASTSSTKKMLEIWGSGNKLKDDAEVFVAEKKGMLIGYMMLKVEGNSGYIDDIVVAIKEQRKGVGCALVRYAEAFAKSKNCHIMKTDTTENADGVPWKSYNFWIKMGYEDTGKRLPTPYDFTQIPFIKRLK